MIHLPEDVQEYLLTFLPPFTLMWLNKQLYFRHHSCIRSHIRVPFLNYVREMIERDNDFVFARIIEENMDDWLRSRTYMYHGRLFNNGIYFIYYFCIEQDSEQCRQVVDQYLDDRNLRRNLHKKNIVKYISNRSAFQWTN